MKVVERAAQIWSVLALAATHRQVLTYGILSRLIGVPTAGLGQLLEPIQSYCLARDLPPLTILIVSETTGMPGTGFTGAQDVPQAQQLVFAFDWLKHGAPSPESLQRALSERPSNGFQKKRPTEG